jgi:VanZ family protein
MNVAPVMPDLPMTNFDKLAHLLMFLALSGSVFFDNTGYLKKKIVLKRIIFGSFFFPVLFSGLIEIMQEYLSSFRSGDWMDFLFDVIGSFIGLVVCFVINRKLKRPNPYKLYR